MSRSTWRSLDELADTPEFSALVEKEFPGLAEDLVDPATRRDFLKILGASLGMVGLTSCRWPKELIVPFAHRPEDRVPGESQQFATAMELGGAALGLLVTSVDGRPVKIEGNPLHPASLGGASAWAQASVLELYDPDRSTRPLQRERGRETAQSWDDFAAFAKTHFEALRGTQGAGLAVLSEASSSPTLVAVRQRFATVFPQAAWHEWEPISLDAEREGARLAFGRPLRPVLQLERADVIVCLDGDPLLVHPDAVRHARDFAEGRRAEDEKNRTMNRLYVAESTLSVTGSVADHRLALAAGDVAHLAARIAQLVAAGGAAAGKLSPVTVAEGDGVAIEAFASAVARDLLAHRGRGVVTAGPRQPAAVHALAHALNAVLGNAGAAVVYVEDPSPDRPTHLDSIRTLAGEMAAGRVETLVMLGCNPAYDAPADLDLASALAKVPTSIHLASFDDETSRLCTWSVPRAHGLESWSDARGWDGTMAVVQPLIEPLYGGKTAAELLALLAGEPAPSAYQEVRKTFAAVTRAADVEVAWRQALNDGLVRDTAYPPVAPPPLVRPLAALAADVAGGQPEGSGLEVVFAADASVYDGRFTNSAWLQELPDPLTRLTWDNAALVSPALAKRLEVTNGDVVAVELRGRSAEVAVFVLPGLAPASVVLPLGYGRTASGRVGDGVGFDAYRLRDSRAPAFEAGVSVKKTGRRVLLATAQDHHVIDEVGLKGRAGRLGEIVRTGTLAEFRRFPHFARELGEGAPAPALFSEQVYHGEHQWAMSIDLSACIGCNACTIACQAENNIPVVGKKQVARGREMHWIRVDRYFSGKAEAPKVLFQPVTCQQCEDAPCEEVCPVGATLHSDEGLNQQVYNRCVGTRYCSNNCPYKVRRFNFFNYFQHVPQVTRMVFNPEVTIRARGVMEKCTFCIQRIEAVKIAAKNARRPIRDGEIVPACAQTCPTRAIVFGDLAEDDSRVAELRENPRTYGLLAELNTKPRLRYLAKLTNPVGEEES